MYKYEYVPVEVEMKFTKYVLEEHRDVIDRYASKGWRFVTAIPTKIIGHGVIKQFDLVFEKEEVRE